jgi:transposase
MNASERDRAHIIRLAIEGRMSQRAGAERLDLCVRQFKRLVRRWRESGDGGLVSRQRGRRSHNALSMAQREQIGSLLTGKYQGFGPTLASEKLLELDGITVSRETVRRLQMELGLWKPKARRSRRVFQLRDRRPRFGELIQIDGSPHDWFEGRGPRCTLIVFIDDATGRLASLRFVPAETTRAYLETLRAHVLTHGVPLAFYSDRLVKEMRLRHIASIEAGNAFLPGFIEAHNKRFAISPRDPAHVHRPWLDTPEALEATLAHREERVLSKALTFSSAGTKYCVKTSGAGTALRGAKVTLLHFVGGGITVHYKDRALAVTAYGHYPVPDPAEDEKTIDVRMDAIVAAQHLISEPVMASGCG